MIPSPRLVQQHLGRRIGREVLHFDTLESTNDSAFFLNEPGLAIIAEEQTAGRGQHKRAWSASRYSSLLLSVTLDPPAAANRPCIIIAWAAVNVAEVIDHFTGLQTEMKWPNDLKLFGRKVCGILTESRGITVVGIGLNLTQEADEFDNAGLGEATSLKIAAGVRLGSEDVAPLLLQKLDDDYSQLLNGRTEKIEERWRRRLGLIGRDSVIEKWDGSEAAGRMLEMSFDSLVLERPDGSFEGFRPEHIRSLKAS